MASAQTHTVTGVVKDEKGAALPGVTIMVKGTTTGTTSMADGRYSVEVSPGNELEFSFLGYTSQTVRIASQTVIDIVLKESSLLAEEVVVTAYAVQKKVNVTGAISQVKGTDLVATPVANISNALLGNTPGVSGLQTSGEPGHNDASIRIRGISTYGSANPLIVIDGVEQPSEQAMAELNAMDANEIRIGAIQYTDDLLANAESIIGHTLDSYTTKYDGLINSLQECYDTVRSNRAELDVPEADSSDYNYDSQNGSDQ